MIGTILSKVFGTKNERELKRLWPLGEKVNDLEPAIVSLSEIQLKEKPLEERSLLQSRKPTKKKLIQASWRVEALHVLLWALQLVPCITDDKTRADQSSLKKLLPFRASTSDFVINSELRADSEIFDMKDAIYQAQWTVRDAEVNGKPAPQDIDPGIIVERHYAINWLMGYLGQAWDDVTTDT